MQTQFTRFRSYMEGSTEIEWLCQHQPWLLLGSSLFCCPSIIAQAPRAAIVAAELPLRGKHRAEATTFSMEAIILEVLYQCLQTPFIQGLILCGHARIAPCSTHGQTLLSFLLLFLKFKTTKGNPFADPIYPFQIIHVGIYQSRPDLFPWPLLHTSLFCCSSIIPQALRAAIVAAELPLRGKLRAEATISFIDLRIPDVLYLLWIWAKQNSCTFGFRIK